MFFNPIAKMFDASAQYWLRESRNTRDPRASAAAAQMSGASEMMAAATNPLDPNFLKAWSGQDIVVRRSEHPHGLFPRK